VIYANYGKKEDFEELVSKGVNITGKVVVAKYGAIFRGLKVRNDSLNGTCNCDVNIQPRSSSLKNTELLQSYSLMIPSWMVLSLSQTDISRKLGREIHRLILSAIYLDILRVQHEIRPRFSVVRLLSFPCTRVSTYQSISFKHPTCSHCYGRRSYNPGISCISQQHTYRGREHSPDT
jgi:hypothetical protein